MKEFKILSDLININTINDKDNKKFIDYLSKLLKKKGFLIETVSDKDNKMCLIAKSKDICNFCFLGHSDTVSFSDNWNSDPLVLTKDKNYLYGLGVCDMKGGIAAFIDALDQTDISKLDSGVMIIITFDEEIGFKGINLIKDRNDIPNNVLIGEPTDLVPIISCKGCIEYEVEFFGKSVHSSVMPEGVNAVLKSCDFINNLNKFFNKLKKDTNKKYSVPYTTMNIATINGGSRINIVPDNCKITFDFRTILKEQHDIINNYVDELCKKYDCKKNKITDVYPNNNTNIESINLIEKISKKKSTGINYVTEGNFLDKNSVFIIGPGPVTAHEVNECIRIDSYKKTVELYKRMISYFCKEDN